MKRSSEALDRFQDDEEIRKILLTTGVIRLVPTAEASLPEVLQQCILDGKIIIVGKNGKVLRSHSSGETIVSHVPKPRVTPPRQKK